MLEASCAAFAHLPSHSLPGCVCLPVVFPQKTSEANVSGLNDLMLALFPDNAELAALTKAAVAPMPDCVPLSLSLDGLLKHSAHHHHTAAEHEAEADEKRRQDIAEAKEERVVPRDPLQMTPEELNQASRLIATCQLKGQAARHSASAAAASSTTPD